jgi:NAD(P)-dependent dehydrogenase (short-subunit alcohol dehydrogenase family)
MASPILGRFILKFFYSQFFVSIPPPTADFSGQTVIVTGSNTGLGFEAVKHLLQLKASKVIIAVRTLSKGETAAEKLRALTGATKNTIEIWQLDLSDSQSVKAFAERANGLDRLDAVISNAGVIGEKWTKVNEMETTLMVNVVNSTLLSLLLLPKLRSSATKHRTRGRFALVGSDMFYVAKLAEANAFGSLFDALNDVESSEIGDR